MKSQTLLLLCLTLLTFNCSKSDDSIDDNQLPEATSNLIIDKNTAKEVAFNDFIIVGGLGCEDITVISPDLSSNSELEITNFSISLTQNLIETGTMQHGESNTWWQQAYSCSAIFQLDNLYFRDSAGTFTISKYEEIFIDDIRHYIVSGSVNITVTSTSGNPIITHTVAFNFNNILINSVGGAC